LFKIILFLFVFVNGVFGANNLTNSSSPYLLQHKDNPVNWYPWGEEAFKKAKKENKFIFLSIGYSTCHWCHVMAEESFEDKEVANLLNTYFVSIKVDREELSHIDSYYQKVHNIITNKHGGWPLTFFLTSERKPIFSATYIPKTSGYGSPGLISILTSLINFPKEDIHKEVQYIEKKLAFAKQNNNAKEPIEDELIFKTINQYKSYYDFQNKGFAQNPKFPQFANIIQLLKFYEISKNKEALLLADDTLDAIAKGGIYDQIEGAFYRYTVDKKWQIPHFEKMLYTNAEALEAFSLAYKLTKKEIYKQIIENTIKEIDFRFKRDELYLSASNAQSPNKFGKEEEGYYFLIKYEEAYDFLKQNNISEKNTKEALAYLGIQKDGNFDGELSNPYINAKKLPKDFEKIKTLLQKMRSFKKYPFIDFKINTAWNALYLKGKLKQSIFNKKYSQEALVSLDKLIDTMYQDNILYHQTIENRKATQKALLEDYAHLASAVFEAYQQTMDKKYLNLYSKLIHQSIELFYKNKKWYQSSDDFEVEASIQESGYANALSTHMINLIRYSALKSDIKTLQLAKETLEQFGNLINNYPSNYPTALIATIMLKVEPVFIKSSKNNLETFDNNEIDYPFVYKHITDEKMFLACTLNSCFSYGTDFYKIKKDIENLILE
jgi:uncharacterized protein YyaL (SSP411 family)